MRSNTIMALMTLVLLAACNKKKDDREVVTPDPVFPQVFLKDIVIPNLPSPYYFFDYDGAGNIIVASHASGDRNYGVFWENGRLTELRNDNMINHDTLRYTYDAAGKISVIRYISETNIIYKRAFITYNGNKLSSIEWDVRQAGGGYIIDRTITFTYHADGNLSEMNDHILPVNGQTETNRITRFEQYDNKQNTDDFILLHEGGIHMLLLPGVKLQKNNPKKVTRVNHYVIDYTYTYNNKDAVLTKSGNLRITHGPNQGQQFQTGATFTYYP